MHRALRATESEVIQYCIRMDTKFPRQGVISSTLLKITS